MNWRRDMVIDICYKENSLVWKPGGSKTFLKKKSWNCPDKYEDSLLLVSFSKLVQPNFIFRFKFSKSSLKAWRWSHAVKSEDIDQKQGRAVYISCCQPSIFQDLELCDVFRIVPDEMRERKNKCCIKVSRLLPGWH